MSAELDLPCPLCGRKPMQLLGNPHGEQYYRCYQPKCYGARDVEGSFFREKEAYGNRRVFERVERNGMISSICRDELAPRTPLDPIPGQPGLFRDSSDPNRIMSVRDFYLDGKRLHRGRWERQGGASFGIAAPSEPDSLASKLEVVFLNLAAEPQRTIARMYALAEGRPLPRIAVNTPPPVPSKPAQLTQPMETKMSEESKKTTKSKIMDQGKDIGSAMLDGLAEATVEEAGDILLDMAKELFEGEALLQIFLATPDGRELVKGLMALVLDSVAVHTSIPKAGALRKLARYQYRSSARRVGGPRIKKVMKRFSKLIELSERLPELPEGSENVVDFATAATAKASR